MAARNEKLAYHVIKMLRDASLQAGAITAATLLTLNPAIAGPEGGHVTRGRGVITTPTATSTVINQGSRFVSIDWASFNVAANESVQFVQPTSSSVALNRIFDQNPSQIFGQVSANGRLLLVNPNGIYFGRSATLNVGALVASTMDITSVDEASGRITLDGAGSRGVVSNAGTIEAAPGGSVALIGSAVENTGRIVASMGAVTLGAGTAATIDFAGDGLMQFAVSGDVAEKIEGQRAAVSNSGEIVADGGAVLLTAHDANRVFDAAINNSGVLRAGRIENHGGSIVLAGSGGDVIHSGVASATGDAGSSSGGEVRISGDRVGLLGSATVDVSGVNGGGNVLIGGGFHGSDSSIQNSSLTLVGADARIDASATGSGDGGNVAVWSDGRTRFAGAIAAEGGATGGDGGFVEVSGAGVLDFTGAVSTLAAAGQRGTLLLDPLNLIVVTAAPGGANGDNTFDNVADISAPNLDSTEFADDGSGTATDEPTSYLLESVLESLLSSSDTRLEAQQTLTIEAGVTVDNATAARVFELWAGDDIQIDGQINLTGNGASFEARSGVSDFAGPGAGDQGAGGSIFVSSTGQVNVTGTGGTITLRGDDAITATGALTADSVVLNSGGGAISANTNASIIDATANGGGLTLDDALAAGTTDYTLRADGAVDVTDAGALRLLAQITDNAGGAAVTSVSLVAGGLLTLPNRTANLVSGGSPNLGSLTLRGTDLAFTANDGGTIGANTFLTAETVDVELSAAARNYVLNVGNATSLTASLGGTARDLTVNSTLASGSLGVTSASASGALVIDTAATANAGVTATGALTGASVTVTADGAISATTVTANGTGGYVNLTANGGSIGATSVTSGTGAGASVSLDATGATSDITLTSLTADDSVSLIAGRSILGLTTFTTDGVDGGDAGSIADAGTGNVTLSSGTGISGFDVTGRGLVSVTSTTGGVSGTFRALGTDAAGSGDLTLNAASAVNVTTQVLDRVTVVAGTSVDISDSTEAAATTYAITANGDVSVLDDGAITLAGPIVDATGGGTIGSVTLSADDDVDATAGNGDLTLVNEGVILVQNQAGGTAVDLASISLSGTDINYSGAPAAPGTFGANTFGSAETITFSAMQATRSYVLNVGQATRINADIGGANRALAISSARTTGSLTVDAAASGNLSATVANAGAGAMVVATASGTDVQLTADGNISGTAPATVTATTGGVTLISNNGSITGLTVTSPNDATFTASNGSINLATAVFDLQDITAGGSVTIVDTNEDAGGRYTVVSNGDVSIRDTGGLQLDAQIIDSGAMTSLSLVADSDNDAATAADGLLTLYRGDAPIVAGLPDLASVTLRGTDIAFTLAPTATLDVNQFMGAETVNFAARLAQQSYVLDVGGATNVSATVGGTARDLTINSGLTSGTLTVGPATASGVLTIDAAAGATAANVTAATPLSGSSVYVVADGAVTTGNVTATDNVNGDVSLRALGGATSDLTITGTVTVVDALTLEAGGSLTGGFNVPLANTAAITVGEAIDGVNLTARNSLNVTTTTPAGTISNSTFTATNAGSRTDVIAAAAVTNVTASANDIATINAAGDVTSSAVSANGLGVGIFTTGTGSIINSTATGGTLAYLWAQGTGSISGSTATAVGAGSTAYVQAFGGGSVSTTDMSGDAGVLTAGSSASVTSDIATTFDINVGGPVTVVDRGEASATTYTITADGDVSISDRGALTLASQITDGIAAGTIGSVSLVADSDGDAATVADGLLTLPDGTQNLVSGATPDLAAVTLRGTDIAFTANDTGTLGAAQFLSAETVSFAATQATRDYTLNVGNATTLNNLIVGGTGRRLSVNSTLGAGTLAVNGASASGALNINTPGSLTSTSGTLTSSSSLVNVFAGGSISNVTANAFDYAQVIAGSLGTSSNVTATSTISGAYIAAGGAVSNANATGGGDGMYSYVYTSNGGNIDNSSVRATGANGVATLLAYNNGAGSITNSTATATGTGGVAQACASQGVCGGAGTGSILNTAVSSAQGAAFLLGGDIGGGTTVAAATGANLIASIGGITVGTTVGGPLDASATNGAVVINETDAVTLGTVSGTGVTVTAGGTITGGIVTAAGNAALTANGAGSDIAGTLVNAGGTASLTANDAITANTAVTTLNAAGGGAIAITEADAVTVGTITGASVALTTSAGTITGGTVTATGNATLSAGGGGSNIAGTTVNAGAIGSLNAAGGITANTAVATLNAAGGGTVNITEANAVTIGSVSGVDVTVTTTNGTITGGTIAGVNSATVAANGAGSDITGTRVTLAAGGLASLTANDAITASTAVGALNATGGGAVNITEDNTVTIGAITGAGVTLTTTNGTITGGTVTATGAGNDVALTAGGAGSGIAGTTIVAPDQATLTAAGAITVTTTVAGLTANSSGGPVTVTETDNLALGTVSGTNVSVTATNGTITGGTVTATGNATLAANGAGNDIAGTTVNAGGTASLTAADAITANTAAGTLNATGGGAVAIAEADAVTVGTITGAGVTLATTAGTITGGTITATGAGNDVAVTAGGAGSGIAGTTIVAPDQATLTAAGAIAVNTTVAGLTATSSGGTVTVTETDNLALVSASGTDVSITTSAGTITGGTVTATGNATLAANGAGNDITGTTVNAGGTASLTAADAITASTSVGTLNATGGGAVAITEANAVTIGTVSGTDVSVTATNGTITGGTVSATNNATVAANGAGSDIAGTTVNAGATGSLTAADAITASTSVGTLNATGGGAVAITEANAVTLGAITGAGVTLTTTAGTMTGGTVTAAGAGNDVVLTAGGAGSNITGTTVVAPDQATLTAGNAITVNTTIAGLTATAGGAIAVTETDGIALGAISGNSVTLSAGGAITDDGNAATRLASATSATLTTTNGAITVGTAVASLTATAGGGGAITVDELNDVALGAMSGSAITMTAGGAITDDGNAATRLVAPTVTLTGGSIGASGTGLGTSVDSLTATATTGGIFVDELSGITLANLTANGAGADIGVTAGGDITATTVRAGDALSLTATSGSVSLGALTAGGAATISAASGTITDINSSSLLTADSATLTAANGIGAPESPAAGSTLGAHLSTAVGSITATTTGAGADIFIREADSITVHNLRTNGGGIELSAGTATGPGATAVVTLGSASSVNIPVSTGATTADSTGANLVGDVLIVSSATIATGLSSLSLPNVSANQVELRAPQIGTGLAATQLVSINANLLRLTLPASVISARTAQYYTLSPNPPLFDVYSVANGIADPAWFTAGFFGIGAIDTTGAKNFFAPRNNTSSAADAASQAGEDPSTVDWEALGQTIEPFGRGQPPICLPADQSEDEEATCGGQQVSYFWPNQPVVVFTAAGLQVKYLGFSGKMMR